MAWKWTGQSWVCGVCGGGEHLSPPHRVCDSCERPQLYPAEKGLRFLYYLLERPVGPGCQPPGSIHWGMMDSEMVLPEIKHHAWGWVEYDHELSEHAIESYELAVVT